MRWYALGIDYEMAGKDLIDSVKLSGQIARRLGGEPPEGFNYELFLDEQGQKISKSRGNGLTIDEWLRYASPESLQLFMYHKPREAKRLYFDVIPRNADEYFQHLAAYSRQDAKSRLANPVWHIHAANPPVIDLPVNFSLLLKLVSACNASERDVLWGFIRKHVAGVSPQTHPVLDQLVGYAINYFHDVVKPAKRYRAPDEVECRALENLSDVLAGLPAGCNGGDHPVCPIRCGACDSPLPGYEGQGRHAATSRCIPRLVQCTLPNSSSVRSTGRGSVHLWPCSA